MNGLSLIALIALAVGTLVAWRAGVRQGRREARPRGVAFDAPAPTRAPHDVVPREPLAAAIASPSRVDAPARPQVDDGEAEDDGEAVRLTAERSRCLRALEAECAQLRRALVTAEAARVQLDVLADDRRVLFVKLAQAAAETARYRQILVDLENHAPPPLLDGPGSPDDLRLIVGVGPVLERMLQQLGVTTYRQIAHWSEHDIDAVDARLPEFPGRIRRDAWVTQARALHQSKYGTRP